eukprot:550100-Rhodomonas_salina.1
MTIWFQTKLGLAERNTSAPEGTIPDATATACPLWSYAAAMAATAAVYPLLSYDTATVCPI